jgi:uncharacterized protein YdbL (DUF1318 family)
MIVKSHIAVPALLVALFCMISCAGGLSFRNQVEVPEEQIALLAGQIEDAVLNTRLDEPTAADYHVDQRTGEVLKELDDPVSVMMDTEKIREMVPALAGLNVDNEIMLSAIRGRILRRPAVMEFQQNGCMGEDRDGLVQSLRGEWCRRDRTLRSRAAFIVMSENRDRRTIYEQVVEANRLGKANLERVRELFAEQIHKRAWAGTPLQMADDTWKRR